jgi:hypothetical protein
MKSVMIGRRPAMRAVAAMAAAGIGLVRSGVARAEEQVPYSSGTERPELKAPASACDCHMHLYDSCFPVAPNARLGPPDAHVHDYRRLQRRLGTTRNVVVTPSTYGTDNRCTLDALRQLGAEARGPTAGRAVLQGLTPSRIGTLRSTVGPGQSRPRRALAHRRPT